MSKYSLDWQKKSLFPYWNLPKNKDLCGRAKKLRKQGILSEVLFWKEFKNKAVIKYDIDRQIIIGNYIVDFFIAELGLVVEIDGSSHNDKQEYDAKRDEYLKGLGLKVLHYEDVAIKRDIQSVKTSFIDELEARERLLLKKKRNEKIFV